MKCHWIFIFITQHSVLMQCICFYTFIHAACFLTIKLCNSESILVKDYVFSCNIWDLNLLFFIVMTMYPSITSTPEWHLICLKGSFIQKWTFCDHLLSLKLFQPVWRSFFYWTQTQMFWRMWVTKQVLVPIDFHSMWNVDRIFIFGWTISLT